MAKAPDIGSKRLISLAPSAWARWLTDDATIDAVEIVSGEFQWISRMNDVLLKVHSQAHGAFLVLCEIQVRPDRRIGLRTRAYAALAEEKHGFPVFAVVVNILPPSSGVAIVDCFHAEFFGQVAHQDFKVVNLWEIDANLVFEHNLTSLLPFVPIMRGGQD